MAKLTITDEWWTSPAEGDNGELVIVTGRKDVEEVRATGKFVYRIEITWKYAGSGMPEDDSPEAKQMEELTDALNAELTKDPVAIMTGIYTGAGERNWVVYSRSLVIFDRKFGEIVERLGTMPVTLTACEDAAWEEYDEMREATYIDC